MGKLQLEKIASKKTKQEYLSPSIVVSVCIMESSVAAASANASPGRTEDNSFVRESWEEETINITDLW